MPHKLLVKEGAVTTKVHMAFYVSATPHPLANSITVTIPVNAQPIKFLLF